MGETATVSLRSALSRNLFIVAAAAALAATRIGVTLFVPPVIGLANNGDFERVMVPVGLGYLTDRFDERYFGWALTEFSIVEPRPRPIIHVTSETPLAGLSVLAVRLVSSRPILDIRVLGALHTLLFLLGMALVLRACRDRTPSSRWLAAAMLVFFFTDVGYTAAFHSLYGQTASLLSFLMLSGIAGLAVRRGGITTGQLCAYFLSAAWFVGSKPQECLQAPLLAVLGILLASSPVSPGRARRLAVVFAVALCGLAVWLYARPSVRAIHDVGVYHTVFMELLPSSPDPVGDLRALGLDPELVRYSGLHAYLPDAPLEHPDFRTQFFDRFGYRELVGFYVLRPARLLDRFVRAGRSAFRLRPANLGNFSHASGAAPKSMSMHSGTWSRWRMKLGAHGLLTIALLFAGNLAAAARGWRSSSWRGRRFREGILLLVLIGTLEFAVCSLADYLGDLPRHLYMFQAIFDLILIADAAWLADSVASRLRDRMEVSHAGEMASASRELLGKDRPKEDAPVSRGECGRRQGQCLARDC